VHLPPGVKSRVNIESRPCEHLTGPVLPDAGRAQDASAAGVDASVARRLSPSRLRPQQPPLWDSTNQQGGRAMSGFERSRAGALVHLQTQLQQLQQEVEDRRKLCDQLQEEMRLMQQGQDAAVQQATVGVGAGVPTTRQTRHGSSPAVCCVRLGGPDYEPRTPRLLRCRP
jgi:hypothetical protein